MQRSFVHCCFLGRARARSRYNLFLVVPSISVFWKRKSAEILRLCTFTMFVLENWPFLFGKALNCAAVCITMTSRCLWVALLGGG
jgi:hypothetical protein